MAATPVPHEGPGAPGTSIAPLLPAHGNAMARAAVDIIAATFQAVCSASGDVPVGFAANMVMFPEVGYHAPKTAMSKRLSGLKLQGHRLLLYCPRDRQYHEAIVEEYLPARKRPYVISYPSSGNRANLNLGEEAWMLAPDDPAELPPTLMDAITRNSAVVQQHLTALLKGRGGVSPGEAPTVPPATASTAPSDRTPAVPPPAGGSPVLPPSAARSSCEARRRLAALVEATLVQPDGTSHPAVPAQQVQPQAVRVCAGMTQQASAKSAQQDVAHAAPGQRQPSATQANWSDAAAPRPVVRRHNKGPGECRPCEPAAPVEAPPAGTPPAHGPAVPAGRTMHRHSRLARGAVAAASAGADSGAPACKQAQQSDKAVEVVAPSVACPLPSHAPHEPSLLQASPLPLLLQASPMPLHESPLPQTSPLPPFAQPDDGCDALPLWPEQSPGQQDQSYLRLGHLAHQLDGPRPPLQQQLQRLQLLQPQCRRAAAATVAPHHGVPSSNPPNQGDSKRSLSYAGCWLVDSSAGEDATQTSVPTVAGGTQGAAGGTDSQLSPLRASMFNSPESSHQHHSSAQQQQPGQWDASIPTRWKGSIAASEASMQVLQCGVERRGGVRLGGPAGAAAARGGAAAAAAAPSSFAKLPSDGGALIGRKRDVRSAAQPAAKKACRPPAKQLLSSSKHLDTQQTCLNSNTSELGRRATRQVRALLGPRPSRRTAVQPAVPPPGQRSADASAGSDDDVDADEEPLPSPPDMLPALDTIERAPWSAQPCQLSRHPIGVLTQTPSGPADPPADRRADMRWGREEEEEPEGGGAPSLSWATCWGGEGAGGEAVAALSSAKLQLSSPLDRQLPPPPRNSGRSTHQSRRSEAPGAGLGTDGNARDGPGATQSVKVSCAGTQGVLLLSHQLVACLCSSCLRRSDDLCNCWTPPSFELHARQGVGHDWRETIMVADSDTPLGAWLQQRGVPTKARTADGSGSSSYRPQLLPAAVVSACVDLSKSSQSSHVNAATQAVLLPSSNACPEAGGKQHSELNKADGGTHVVATGADEEVVASGAGVVQRFGATAATALGQAVARRWQPCAQAVQAVHAGVMTISCDGDGGTGADGDVALIGGTLQLAQEGRSAQQQPRPVLHVGGGHAGHAGARLTTRVSYRISGDGYQVLRCEDPGGFEVLCLVPGYSAEEVAVQAWDNGTVVIQAQVRDPVAALMWGTHASLRRQLRLPRRVDARSAQALMTLHGQLYVRLNDPA